MHGIALLMYGSNTLFSGEAKPRGYSSVKGLYLAKSVDEVLAELNTYAGKARIIAGGSDAMLDLNSGKLKTDCLIDITKIGELKKIDYMDGQIVIGAAVTHSEVKNSELIKTKAALSSDASGPWDRFNLEIRLRGWKFLKRTPCCRCSRLC